ncbi:TPA: hypothetical protein N0F65_007639 [Lagenidium giganteum]|uniref:Ribosomal protein S6 n=1 Tax=Lagenidium giganteum TaxID=4803 RepID=A0AAV2Z891_9STRA|nr:TPA: hypothetical protein N0F65_007639 [Lagenidium giganteum]
MPLYKQVLITNLKSSPKDVAKIFQECAKMITSKGGVIRGVENRGEKRLGYAVEDRRWGELQRHYEGKLIVSQFNTSPAVLKEGEMKLKNSFPIIRFQTFKVRDPIDTLMNTRQPLDKLQTLLNPKAEVHADKKAMTEDDLIEDLPNSMLDDSEKARMEQFKNYVPEWKRDAMFTPSPPEHLKN